MWSYVLFWARVYPRIRGIRSLANGDIDAIRPVRNTPGSAETGLISRTGWLPRIRCPRISFRMTQHHIFTLLLGCSLLVGAVFIPTA
jgi:hypothetical protein